MSHLRTCVCGVNSRSSFGFIFVLYLLRVHSISSLVPSKSHLRSCVWGVNSRSGSSSRLIFVLYLLRVHSISGSRLIYVSPKIMCVWGVNSTFMCCTFWRCTPSPAPVPSMSHLRSYVCGGSTPDLDPAPDPYLCCTFWGSTPLLASVPSMSHLKTCVWGVNSRSSFGSIFVLYLLKVHSISSSSPDCLTLDHVWGGSTPDLALDPYLCCTFWGSTPSPAPVPSMSHLRSCLGGQLQIQIPICVVSFQDPLHLWLQSHLCLTFEHVCRGSTPDTALDPYLCCTFWGSTPSPAPVPSMSHLRSYVGGKLQIQLWIHICVVPFDGILHLQLQLQSHLSLTLDHGESTLDPDLCCTFWGPTLSWAPVPSMSHLRPYMGGQLWLHLQSHLSNLSWLWGSTPEKSGVNSTSSVFRNLSAVHDWMGSSPLYGQWAKNSDFLPQLSNWQPYCPVQ